MATLTKVTGPTAYATAMIKAVWTAYSGSGNDDVVLTGRDILLVRNVAGVAKTFTLTSQTDPYGRTGHITAQSLDAGGYYLFGPIPTIGYANSAGKLLIAGEDTNIEFCVFTLHP